MQNTLKNWFEKMPVIAILRGVPPAQAVAIGEALHSAGIGIIEVPLNSSEPLRSIENLAHALGDHCIIGAGTVLDASSVDAVADAGGQIIVAPNTDSAVITRALERGLTPMPGWATASEAFTAWNRGARYLKLFPAGTYGPNHVKALRAVLPSDCAVLAVGGVAVEDMSSWLAAGVAGFGIGTQLYRPDWDAEQVAIAADRIVTAYREAKTAS